MNLFEASVIPAVPVAAVIGATLALPHGTVATVGGAVAGGAVGFAGGWLHALALMTLMMMFTGLWSSVRRRPTEAGLLPDHLGRLTRFGRLGALLAVSAAGVTYHFSGALRALLVLALATVATALLSVIGAELGRAAAAGAGASDGQA